MTAVPSRLVVTLSPLEATALDNLRRQTGMSGPALVKQLIMYADQANEATTLREKEASQP